MKRLARSLTDRKVAGVCGGLGEYLQVDPTLIRLLWAIGILATGCFPGVIAYLLAWAVIPEQAPGE